MRYFLRAESFFNDVARRVVPPGLLRRIKALTLEGGQFLSATHSPILLAHPDALIYELRAEGPVPTAYEDTDHYRLTRAFLNAPDRLLRELFA